MSETRVSTVLTYFSPGGDVEIPIPENNPFPGDNFLWRYRNGWVAAWNGNGFVHTNRLSGEVRTSDIIRYTTWNGEFWEARYHRSGTERGYFIHTRVRDGVSHKDKLINYLDWDGNLWSATRKSETEFQHVFFAAAVRRKSFLEEIGDWIEDHWREIVAFVVEYVLKNPDDGEEKKANEPDIPYGSTITEEYWKSQNL
jgi:hypothetical protein